MPRSARSAIGGVVYHVLNHGNGRMRIFRTPEDFEAFAQLLLAAKEHAAVELFAFCLMPDHWHLVLRPQRGKDMAAYLSWLTNTHVRRHRAHYRNTSGHLYQGRYKSFAVAEDRYFLTLLRYVESNPLRAKLVRRAQAWRWSSLGGEDKLLSRLLDKWPVPRPRNWTSLVNQSLDQASVARLQVSFIRGRPLGSDAWTQAAARRMGPCKIGRAHV